MSFNFTSDSLDEIHEHLMGALSKGFDYESAPRGKPIREIIAATFTLTNPRNRIIGSKVRAVNYGFAVGELCWYLRGDNDLATMLFYNKRMAQFSDDNVTINSAYGARMFGERWNDAGQFDNVVKELLADPDSRRAVMHINEPNDLRRAVTAGSKDVPCTMSMQLLIRDHKLHMHVLMRSNDVVWGMPYDVFSFTCIQECIMLRLKGLGAPVDDIGSYHHTAGSLHIYDTHFAMADKVFGEKHTRPAQMAPIDLGMLYTLAEDDEPAIRTDEWADIWGTQIVSYEKDAVWWMFCRLLEHKNKRITEEAQKKEKAEALLEPVQTAEEVCDYDTDSVHALGCESSVLAKHCDCKSEKKEDTK